MMTPWPPLPPSTPRNAALNGRSCSPPRQGNVVNDEEEDNIVVSVTIEHQAIGWRHNNEGSHIIVALLLPITIPTPNLTTSLIAAATMLLTHSPPQHLLPPSIRLDESAAHPPSTCPAVATTAST
ncbi:hypothetical protein ACHAXS_005765 [Conticribra weissflogii]